MCGWLLTWLSLSCKKDVLFQMGLWNERLYNI